MNNEYINDNIEYDYRLKICMIGDSSVGKTSLIYRLTTNNFNINHNTTIGVDFGTYTFKIDNKNVKIHIWDTAGQERYRSICKIYFREVTGFLLTFDLTDIISYNNIKQWINIINEEVEDPMILIVGNKKDDTINRVIKKKDIILFIQKNNYHYIETSAKTGENVYDAFECLVILIINNIIKPIQIEIIQLFNELIKKKNIKTLNNINNE